MRLILHDYWRSSAAYRVRLALALKGVEVERRAVNLLAGEQSGGDNRAVNPQGLVPTLEVDGVHLTQSLAIIEWLDATYADPPLIPRDPLARARTTARALVIAADIHPIDNLRVLRWLKDEFGVDQAGRDRWYRHWITEGFAALERMATDGVDGPFLGGPSPDLSDLCLVPQMYNARRLDTPLDAFPRLVAADAAARALPQMIMAHPDHVKP